MKVLQVILLSLSLSLPSLRAQSLTGLWAVEKVNVGEQEMTPVAKWFEFTEDNGYTSGNGWLQNGAGTYNFNENELSTANQYGKPDAFGAFKVKISGGQMEWQRKEEGAVVTVHLHRIEELPKSPADQIQGNWTLTAAEGDTSTVDIPETIFIRWDKVYRASQNKKDQWGIWRMHAHRPEFSLHPFDRELPSQSFTATFSGSEKLTLRQSNSEITLNYKRTPLD